MKCKYCKTELDGASICKNCGAPAPLDEDYKEDWNEMMGYIPDEDSSYDPEYDLNYDSEYDADEEDLVAYEKKQKELRLDAKKNRLGTIALVLAVTGVFAPIGFILAIIDITLRKDGSRKIPSKLAMITSIFVVDIFILLFFVYGADWNEETNMVSSVDVTYAMPDYKIAMQVEHISDGEEYQVFHVYISYIDVMTEAEFVLVYEDIQNRYDCENCQIYFYESKEAAEAVDVYSAYMDRNGVKRD